MTDKEALEILANAVMRREFACDEMNEAVKRAVLALAEKVAREA